MQNPTRIVDLEPVEGDDGYILCERDTDRVHYLNPVAALIFELCNGERSVSEIAALVQEAFGLEEAPDSEVLEALGKMKEEGLLQ